MSKKKKKKKSHPILDYLAYLGVRILSILILISPPDQAMAIARFFGRLLFKFYKRGRLRALENIQLSYPEKSPNWHTHTARRSFEHLAMFAFDMLFTHRLIRPTSWHRFIEFENITEALQLMLSGRSLLMVTGHYGNFEVLGKALDILGLHTYNIARPIDNPYLNHYVYENLHRGQTIIYKKGATAVIPELLQAGQAVGIVGDQDGSRKDIFVDFFGRKASTYKSVALMAITYQCPIIVGYARRVNDDYRFKIGITKILRPEDWQDQPNPVRWITQQWTTAIETFVRQDPEQYWWIHRRWKTRPPEERRAQAAQASTPNSPPANAPTDSPAVPAT